MLYPALVTAQYVLQDYLPQLMLDADAAPTADAAVRAYGFHQPVRVPGRGLVAAASAESLRSADARLGRIASD